MSPRRLVQLIGLVAAFALVMAIVIKWAPMWLASDEQLTPQQRIEEVGRVRTAVLTALAGLIAVIGAYYTSRTFALNRQGQITERFTRAIDQLGSQVLDVRLGGIYALERLARESRDDYGPIVEILAAYVRERAPLNDCGADDNAEALKGAAKPSTDVQAALTVLARRIIDHGAGPTLDLSSTNVSGAQLRSAHLEGANFRGAHLTGAELSHAHLRRAILIGANLEAAHLDDADLKGAIFDAETLWPEDFNPFAKGAIKTGVRQRLVLCCDGTWTWREGLGRREPTNVAKVATLVAPADPAGTTPQLLLYLPGNGRGLLGLSAEVLRCYRFIVENYKPSDDLFLFGFSRGAYIARTVAGLVLTAGILRPEHIDRLEDAYALYRSRTSSTTPRGIEAHQFRGAHSHPEADITFIGVWETVGVLGIPAGVLRPPLISRRWWFHHTTLSTRVRHAYHALAIDEDRRAFKPVLWKESSPDAFALQQLEQVWFSGNHGDVGGGYRDAKLSDIPLRWMMERAGNVGLVFKDTEKERISIAPDPLGTMHYSRRGVQRFFRAYHRQLWGHRGEGVASSAVRRLKDDRAGYAPSTLAGESQVQVVNVEGDASD